jgi:hypothetical protein
MISPQTRIGAMLAMVRRHPPTDMDKAGPCFRRSIAALEGWRDLPPGSDAIMAASAMCEAAEDMRHRLMEWTPAKVCVHPWPWASTCMRSLYSMAETLSPGILDDVQRAA